MITVNVISRVFHLKYGGGTGTCFIIEHDEKQYFVTAKHVLKDLREEDSVYLYYKNSWCQFNTKLVGHHETADISVFVIENYIMAYPMEPSSSGIVYGQDTYFLGFPYQLQDEENSPINREFPFPLVKKATLSLMSSKDQDAPYYMLDGINNPGFSGGPVVFKNGNEKNFKVAAVISGYRYRNEPTFKEDKELSITVRVNTGIIIAYEIRNAIELIEDNPIGLVPKSKN